MARLIGLPPFCRLTPFLSLPIASIVSVETVSPDLMVSAGGTFKEKLL
jgi:hypothetical protein